MGRFKTLKPRLKALDVRRGASLATPRITGRRLQENRKQTFYRDDYTCKECGAVIPDADRLRQDHKIPLELGGAESQENSQTLCEDCHDRKTAEEAAAMGRRGDG